MNRRDNIVIHMGASVFEAHVRTPAGSIHFDLNKMTKKQEHQFRRELVASWREANMEAA